jgi:prepilin-type processing-associated H-X9-DG protein
MHEFPPSWWPLSNYGLAGLPFGLTILVAVLLILSIRMTGSRWVFIMRLAILIALPPIVWRWQKYHDPAIFHPIKGQVTGSLMVALIIVAFQGVFRELRKYRQAGQSWKSIGTASLVGSLIGILGLVTLWPPAVSHAPEASARTQCKNNLKQIGLALHNYHDRHQMFPIPVQQNFDRSWRITVLPLMDQEKVYARYNQDAEWDHASNLPLAEEIVRPLDCPGRPVRTDNQGRFITAYTALTGPGAAFETGKYIRLRDFTDGTTLMVTEACGKQIVWTEPKDVSTETDVLQINAAGPQLHQSNGIASSYHMGGANMLMSDGSVKFTSQNIDREVLEKIVSRAGEPIRQETLETDF